jgi:hypothetical protein
MELQEKPRTVLGMVPARGGSNPPMVVSTLLLRHFDSSGRLNGLFILRDAVCAYLLFIVIALAAGLDSDHRVVATAIWGRHRDNVQRTIVRV